MTHETFYWSVFFTLGMGTALSEAPHGKSELWVLLGIHALAWVYRILVLRPQTLEARLASTLSSEANSVTLSVGGAKIELRAELRDGERITLHEALSSRNQILVRVGAVILILFYVGASWRMGLEIRMSVLPNLIAAFFILPALGLNHFLIPLFINFVGVFWVWIQFGLGGAAWGLVYVGLFAITLAIYRTACLKELAPLDGEEERGQTELLFLALRRGLRAAIPVWLGFVLIEALLPGSSGLGSPNSESVLFKWVDQIINETHLKERLRDFARSEVPANGSPKEGDLASRSPEVQMPDVPSPSVSSAEPFVLPQQSNFAFRADRLLNQYQAHNKERGSDRSPGAEGSTILASTNIPGVRFFRLRFFTVVQVKDNIWSTPEDLLKLFQRSPTHLSATNEPNQTVVMTMPPGFGDRLPVLVPAGFVPAPMAGEKGEVITEGSGFYFFRTKSGQLEIPLVPELFAATGSENLEVPYYRASTGSVLQEWPKSLVDFIQLLQKSRSEGRLAGPAGDFELANILARWIASHFNYTNEKSPSLSAVDLARSGKIQCDTATTILVSILRDQFGILARPAVGYVAEKISNAPTSVVRLSTEGHAWTEVLGPSGNWQALDPTPSLVTPAQPSVSPESVQSRGGNAQAVLPQVSPTVAPSSPIGAPKPVAQVTPEAAVTPLSLPSVTQEMPVATSSPTSKISSLPVESKPFRLSPVWVGMMATFLIVFRVGWGRWRKRRPSIDRALRSALRGEIEAMYRTRPSVSEEIRQSYQIYLKILSAAQLPREEGTPPLGYLERVTLAHPKIEKDSRTLTQSFSDEFYGAILPERNGLDEYRKSFKQVTRYFSV